MMLVPSMSALLVANLRRKVVKVPASQHSSMFRHRCGFAKLSWAEGCELLGTDRFCSDEDAQPRRSVLLI